MPHWIGEASQTNARMTRFTSPLKVIVADDDAFVRRMIRQVLQEAGIVVVADAANGRECVELALHYRPHVLIVDLLMPEWDGMEVIRRIRASGHGEMRIIVLTSARDEDLAVLALRSGADGFLTKDVDVVDLPRAVVGAVKGEAVITRRMGRLLIERLRSAPEARVGVRPVHSPLTAREWEVLDMLCEQRGTDEIASDLVLSPETVRSHVRSILRKLGVHSREELAPLLPRVERAS